MKFAYIEDGKVIQVEPEYRDVFPGVPFAERFSAEFVSCCVPVDDGEVSPGMAYDAGAGRFYYENNPPADTLAQAVEMKTSEINAACNAAIVAGFDYGGKRYSLTDEDQINIISLLMLAQAGQDVPYHADGEECGVYSAQEFMAVAQTATAFKLHHTTYCNLLKLQVRAMTDIDAVMAVRYGDTRLDGDFAEHYNAVMTALQGDSHD